MGVNSSALPSGGNGKYSFVDKTQLMRIEQQIEQLNKKNGNNVVLFTSSYEKEGVSTILSGLARFMSQNSTPRKVLVIDGNLHSPAMNSLFNIHSGPGLSDVLLDLHKEKECIYPCKENSNVHIMPVGHSVEEISGGINKEKIEKLIKSLKDDFDYIFFDSSPVMKSADSLSMAMASHVTLLVIHANRVPLEVARTLKKMLENNDCQLGGAILNRFQPVIPEWLYNKL